MTPADPDAACVPADGDPLPGADRAGAGVVAADLTGAAGLGAAGGCVTAAADGGATDGATVAAFRAPSAATAWPP